MNHYDVVQLPVRNDGAQLYEINGVVMRRMTMLEFIAFTGFNSYDLQRPETQPLKYNWILEGDPAHDPIMHIGGRPVHKVYRDLRGRVVANVQIHQCFTDDFCHRVRCNNPLRNACGQRGNNAITIQYPDGMIWHHDGGIYVPVTETELQDPDVMAKCRPLTQKDIELALMRLRKQKAGGRTSMIEQTMDGIEFTSNHPEANVTVLKETDQPCLRAVGFEEVFELRMNFCPVCGVCLVPNYKKG